ncbi:gamma-glutamylcyclotransferase [Rhizobium grahamii]|uniref:glutathione-specific gamma-glutamylcyclotransferase n=1 Tax=Rhizobium grahamii CCGE 502 TaxID=990285 RepID=S3HLQ2_9HYPH|nr:gamma-glutamylcyclotransferase [Rhizobium grahamii]EPE94321.1 ChaC family protein [Rhizobium grahamii CCGE 502]
MTLTQELVLLSVRTEEDPGADPTRVPLSEEQLSELAKRLHDEAADEPLWIFAYGSLIWKPDFDAILWRRGRVRGWHRSFCLRMTRWRGSEKQPGLMMALRRGGQCNGIAYRLADSDRIGQIRRMIRREVGTLEDASTIRWITVETDDGPLRALVFWAGPKGERVVANQSLSNVAKILARACGHMGSCAEYLYLTVHHLEMKGIRDRNLWRLQEMVAAEIKRIHGIPELA